LKNQPVKVAVFGLGYVGCVTAACLARNGHSIIGVDISPDKLDNVRAGRAPLGEPGLDAIIRETVAAERLTVSDDAAYAVQQSDISLICVGTPSLENGALTTGHLERVCEQVGMAIKDAASNHVVCIRSTMLPGTLRNIIIPSLERSSGLESGKDFHVAVNPEFLREGSAIADFDGPPKVVIGTDSEYAAEIVGRLYSGIDAPSFHIPADVAELVKCVDNAWHATKITFANEVGQLCRIADIDSHELIEVFLSDRQLNISTAYLVPGFAFGGSCLPKDLRALNYFARHSDLTLPVIDHVLASNTTQIERIAKRILSLNARRIAIYGLSFKTDTDDLRESPMVRLAEILIGKGCELKIYDPNIDPKEFTGTNKEYIETHVPHLGRLLVSKPELLVEDVDLLVIGHKTKQSEELSGQIPAEVPVLDLVRLDGLSGKPNASGLYW